MYSYKTVAPIKQEAFFNYLGHTVSLNFTTDSRLHLYNLSCALIRVLPVESDDDLINTESADQSEICKICSTSTTSNLVLLKMVVYLTTISKEHEKRLCDFYNEQKRYGVVKHGDDIFLPFKSDVIR